MKTIISLVTTMVFVFAFGTAFADDWPTDKKSYKFLGTEMHDEVFQVQKAEVKEPGAAAGGLRAAGIDKSEMILESLLGNYVSTEEVDTYRDMDRGFAKPEAVSGAAPGGLRAEKADKGGEIFNSLLGERGSKADMHIAY
jgi:hypothetical protein